MISSFSSFSQKRSSKKTTTISAIRGKSPFTSLALTPSKWRKQEGAEDHESPPGHITPSWSLKPHWPCTPHCKDCPSESPYSYAWRASLPPRSTHWPSRLSTIICSFWLFPCMESPPVCASTPHLPSLLLLSSVPCPFNHVCEEILCTSQSPDQS